MTDVKSVLADAEELLRQAASSTGERASARGGVTALVRTCRMRSSTAPAARRGRPTTTSTTIRGRLSASLLQPALSSVCC